jgi:ribose transport system permease protein
VKLRQLGNVKSATLGWVFPLVACLSLWAIASAFAGGFTGNLLLVNITLASFLGLVSVGQMMVIALGSGSFDLSLPYAMTLAAFVSGAISGGTDHHLALAILGGLGAGLVVGMVNGLFVLGPGLPPIVATLASGYVVYTLILVLQGQGEASPAPSLGKVVRGGWHGLTPVVGLSLVAWLLVALARGRGRYGMYLHSIGQSRGAARLAGVPVNAVILATFALSGLLAGVAGVLLSGYVGGAFADMGSPYLLLSLAAVVVGGTSVRGGQSAIAATVLGAIAMTLVTAVIELSHKSIGVQDMAEGLIVIAVVMLTRVPWQKIRLGRAVLNSHDRET